MSGSGTRLELRIDVFEKADQRALALASLTPREFVASVLQEFRELEYLGDNPSDYRLIKADGSTGLDDEQPIGKQLDGGEQLTLVEAELPLPEGTQRPSDRIYLREQATGKVYKLHWQPAIVGRVSENQPHNAWVAVDLQAYPTGLRVSRRHLMISEKNGKYFVENVSNNPAFLLRGRREKGDEITADKQSLKSGDVLRLERSEIALKFIVRSAGTAE